MFEQGINTQEQAYWLGFIYADGCITGKVKDKFYQLSIGLGEKDINHLYFIKEFLGKGTISYYPKTKSYRYTYCDVKNISLLISLGIMPNKTYENSSIVFDSIPNNLKRHFIRGYFDGDGGFYKNGNKTCYGFVSLNEKLLESIRIHLFDLGILSVNSLTKDGKYFRLRISGNPNSKKFEDKYLNQSKYLSSKKKRFL